VGYLNTGFQPIIKGKKRRKLRRKGRKAIFPFKELSMCKTSESSILRKQKY